jgi:DNA-directed RNA polymerase beta' subunit
MITNLPKKENKKFYTSYSKLSEIKIIKIGYATSFCIKKWAEKTLPNGKIIGEVMNANTLHYKTLKPQKGGLFCERIFGPLKDFECACGKSLKYKKQLGQKKKDSVLTRLATIDEHVTLSFDLKLKNPKFESSPTINSIFGNLGAYAKKRDFCEICDVEYTWSVIRRYQLGYIKLVSPIIHIWYLKGMPSYLSLLLQTKRRALESIIYCSKTPTIEYALKGPPILLESSHIISTWKKLKSDYFLFTQKDSRSPTMVGPSSMVHPEGEQGEGVKRNPYKALDKGENTINKEIFLVSEKKKNKIKKRSLIILKKENLWAKFGLKIRGFNFTNLNFFEHQLSIKNAEKRNLDFSFFENFIDSFEITNFLKNFNWHTISFSLAEHKRIGKLKKNSRSGGVKPFHKRELKRKTKKILQRTLRSEVNYQSLNDFDIIKKNLFTKLKTLSLLINQEKQTILKRFLAAGSFLKILSIPFYIIVKLNLISQKLIHKNFTYLNWLSFSQKALSLSLFRVKKILNQFIFSTKLKSNQKPKVIFWPKSLVVAEQVRTKVNNKKDKLNLKKLKNKKQKSFESQNIKTLFGKILKLRNYNQKKYFFFNSKKFETLLYNNKIISNKKNKQKIKKNLLSKQSIFKTTFHLHKFFILIKKKYKVIKKHFNIIKLFLLTPSLVTLKGYQPAPFYSAPRRTFASGRREEVTGHLAFSPIVGEQEGLVFSSKGDPLLFSEQGQNCKNSSILIKLFRENKKNLIKIENIFENYQVNNSKKLITKTEKTEKLIQIFFKKLNLFKRIDELLTQKFLTQTKKQTFENFKSTFQKFESTKKIQNLKTNFTFFLNLKKKKSFKLKFDFSLSEPKGSENKFIVAEQEAPLPLQLRGEGDKKDINFIYESELALNQLNRYSIRKKNKRTQLFKSIKLKKNVKLKSLLEKPLIQNKNVPLNPNLSQNGNLTTVDDFLDYFLFLTVQFLNQKSFERKKLLYNSHFYCEFYTFSSFSKSFLDLQIGNLLVKSNYKQLVVKKNYKKFLKKLSNSFFKLLLNFNFFKKFLNLIKQLKTSKTEKILTGETNSFVVPGVRTSKNLSRVITQRLKNKLVSLSGLKLVGLLNLYKQFKIKCHSYALPKKQQSPLLLRSRTSTPKGEDWIKRLENIPIENKNSVNSETPLSKILSNKKNELFCFLSKKQNIKTKIFFSKKQNKLSYSSLLQAKLSSDEKNFSIFTEKKLYNNFYSIFHRARWGSDISWNLFYLFMTGSNETNQVLLPNYKKRFDYYLNFKNFAPLPFADGPSRSSLLWAKSENQPSSSPAMGTLSYSATKGNKKTASYSDSLLPVVSSLGEEREQGEFNSKNYVFYSGPGIIKELLNEFTLKELYKMNYHNKILLTMENKKIFELKKNLFINKTIINKKKLKKIKKLYKRRYFFVRKAKLIRTLFKKESYLKETILTVLPVLPPELRPIVKLGNQIASSDLNRLYQRVIYRNDRLKKFLKDPATSSSFEMKYAQRLLQESVDNLIQNNGISAEKDSRGRLLKSLSDSIKGKQGRFRQYLLGKRVDYSGRSVIVVGPKLKLHECGLPKEMALELYLPFLLKRILNENLARTVVGAKNLLKTNPLMVFELLREIMQTCPVLLNRAPTLHRLGIQAFQPKLIEGRAILLHPLVCSAFNADFDGDQMAVHVPITVEARAEAWKLMLSRNNILSPATGDPLAIPSQDMLLGCYYLTIDLINRKIQNVKKKKGSGSYFSTIDQVLKAYDLQLLELHTNIWLKWSKEFENGFEKEQILEISLDLYGNRKEISNKTQRILNFKETVSSLFLLTTPGKIIFNKIILNAIMSNSN